MRPAHITLRPDRHTGFTPTLPIEAIELALDFERRGYLQSVDATGQYQIEPRPGLSEGDLARIARWRLHLACIVAYQAPEIA